MLQIVLRTGQEKLKICQIILDFTHTLERQHILHLEDFYIMFKKLVIDKLLQKWYNDMKMCNYLPMFKHVKINFGSLNVS